jgi:hypothetical protein
VTIERLLALLAEAGFVDAHRRDDVMFQPVLVGRRPRERSASSKPCDDNLERHGSYGASRRELGAGSRY